MKQAAKSKIYQCPICHLHYTDKATAEKCEAWCKNHKSCSVEVAKLSIEARK